MKLLECRPTLHEFSDVNAFAKEFQVGAGDLVLTNRFILDAETVFPGAQALYQEDFGQGEPTDAMLRALLKQAGPHKRVVGIGGGTVMDLAKLMSLKVSAEDDLPALFQGKIAAEKACPCVLAPTTCGTGSEMTNVAVVLFEQMGMKLGLASEALYASDAALIPALMRTLPYGAFAFSSIDALIHAVESYLSPRATEITRMFSRKAIQMVLRGYKNMQPGNLPGSAVLADFLRASTYAGIAFGNAGCGAVHAMSYPIGGKYHVAHGEANYLLFPVVLRFYDALPEKRPLEEFKRIVAGTLECDADEALAEMEVLLGRVWRRRTLSEAGMTESDFREFPEEVYQRQQRLLKGAMKTLSREDLEKIYDMAR